MTRVAACRRPASRAGRQPGWGRVNEAGERAGRSSDVRSKASTYATELSNRSCGGRDLPSFLPSLSFFSAYEIRPLDD